MGSRILVVDDEKLVRWTLRQALEEAGYQVDEAGDTREAIAAIARELPDLVLLDYRLPDQSGLAVLRELRGLGSNVPVVMITAHASVGGAVEAMKEGAYDYVSKPFEIEEVLQTVARALEAGRLRAEVARQRAEDLRSSGVEGMIAASESMQEVLRLVRRVAASEATTILILGESGVGKGMIARALHAGSTGASDRPFLHITCTALPETLLESELFGHEKGAFTDAKAQKKGLFELADSGTVFLDEIGDLSPSLQGKLLRFLEDKVFRRVGGTRDLRVSVRIIAATNKDLAAEVASERFRRDLYYRLKVIPIEVPPLRQRREEILPLADSFIRHFNRELRKHVRGVSTEAAELMRAYDWPGNVRELRNAIERAVLLTEGPEIQPRDLPVELRSAKEPADGNPHRDPIPAIPAGPTGGFQLPPEGVVLEDLERELLRQALERVHGNRTRAARLLGINRDRIRYRIHKFHLEEFARDD
jgi:DNA-binding NtrC family response regulator